MALSGTGTVEHSTAADGTFSTDGSDAWNGTSAHTVIVALTGEASTAQIADDAVTYSKIQDVTATSRILGRISSGAGVIEELTAANVKTILAYAHSELTGIGTNTHAQIDDHIASTSNPHSVTKAQVGLTNVTDDVQTKAAVVPNTAPSSGQILAGNAGGTAYAPVSMSGDATLASTGAITVANDAITYAKIQNVSATSRFLGRITASAGDVEELTAANAKTILALAQADISGLTTADSPQFTAVNIGAATDTTLARVSAGVLSVEGNTIYAAGGTDVAIADGGTGSSTAAGAATNLGLGTGDSPQFTAVNIGHATDTTITRVSAGVIAVEGAQVTTQGNTVTGSGSIVLATSPTLTTPTLGVSSATSINFGQTALSYYGEGTWTPALGGTATYNGRTGTYTRIGRLVHVEANINVNTIGTGSAIVVSGLPFAAIAGAEGSGKVGYFTGLATSVVAIFLGVDAGASTLRFGYTTAAQTAITQTTLLGNATNIFFSAEYHA